MRSPGHVGRRFLSSAPPRESAIQNAVLKSFARWVRTRTIVVIGHIRRHAVRRRCCSSSQPFAPRLQPPPSITETPPLSFDSSRRTGVPLTAFAWCRRRAWVGASSRPATSRETSAWSPPREAPAHVRRGRPGRHPRVARRAHRAGSRGPVERQARLSAPSRARARPSVSVRPVRQPPPRRAPRPPRVFQARGSRRDAVPARRGAGQAPRTIPRLLRRGAPGRTPLVLKHRIVRLVRRRRRILVAVFRVSRIRGRVRVGDGVRVFSRVSRRGTRPPPPRCYHSSTSPIIRSNRRRRFDPHSATASLAARLSWRRDEKSPPGTR